MRAVAARVGISTALLLVASGMWLFAGAPFRLLSALALLVFTGCLLAFVLGASERAVVLSGLVLVGAVLSPVEVSLARRPGPPGIVPLIMGYPGPVLRERAKKGEVVLGGCMKMGFEPRWVVIW